MHAGRLLGEIAEIERDWARVRQSAPAPVPGAEGLLAAVSLPPDTDVGNVLKLADKRSGAVVAARTREGAIVHYPVGELTALRKKIEAYGDDTKDTTAGRPKNEQLVARIDDLRLADIADLSDGWLTEGKLDLARLYWVELWLPGGRTATEEDRLRTHAKVDWLLAQTAQSIEARWFTATEREVALVQLSGERLITLPIDCPEVYEVRPPQQAIVPHMLAEQATTPISPGAALPEGPEVVVSLWDTGIAEQHPLLRDLLVTPSASTVVGDPSVVDTAGHGTRMAGVVAFVDLADALGAGRVPQARTRLQNVRLMQGSTTPAADMEFWPERMQDAALEAEKVDIPRRVISMAIGGAPDPDRRRSAWAVAIDHLGYAVGAGQLFCLPTGNIRPTEEAATAYPDENLATAMSTPAEALNAITVGAVTDLTTVPSNHSAVAQDGQLSPFSRCDSGGTAIKPDVVGEGGNWTINGAMVGPHPSVGILTTSRGHAIGPPLEWTSATSAACSSISGLIAEIWRENHERRPETIRALLIHSARWTAAMRTQFPDKTDLLRSVGYGRPSRDVASFSTNSRPTLVLEHEISLTPDADNRRRVHLVDLPLPTHALHALGDQVVELSVTLSYFTEPNENAVRNYSGFGLRWRLQRPLQSDKSFFRSFNRLATEKVPGSGSHLDWEIGETARQRGTVQSDRCRVSATELANCGKLAVYPALGWWDGRPDRADRVIPYAVVVTINAGESGIDLYTPIKVAVDATVPIDVEITS